MLRRPGFTDPRLVYSNKSASSTVGFFFPLTGTAEAADLKNVRVGIDIYAPGAVAIKVAYQSSDDGTTWSPSTTVPSQFSLAAATTEGQTLSATFEDISANLTKKHVRFGVWVYNASGTATEFAFVAIRLETKS